MTESVLRLVPPNNDPLNDLASRIRDQFALAVNSYSRAYNARIAADSARIAAGLLLIEARNLCQQRGQPWEAWCKENIWNRSPGDIRKVMALAGAPDPEAAHRATKEHHREEMARHRSHVGPVSQKPSVESNHRAHVSAVSQELPVDLATLQAAVAALSIEDFAAFKAWFFGYCGRS